MNARISLHFSLALIAWLAAAGHAEAARKPQDDGCTTGAYGQCGGITCTNGNPSCTDSAYTCCPSNFACLRQSQWYWQCLPNGDASASTPGSAPAETSSPHVSSPQSPSTVPVSSPPTTFPPPPPEEYSPPSEEYSPLPEEYSPESSPEGASPSEGVPTGACDYAASGIYQHVSYLDNSGKDAPDGNYKETCADITYSCTTDTLTASCSILDPRANITAAAASFFTTTSLAEASYCFGNIANEGGALVCQGYLDYETAAPGPETPCGAVIYDNYYASKLDTSGFDAPDGSYKESCKLITYACDSDTIFASCWNGQIGSKHRYLQTALQNATLCYNGAGIVNVWGTLACIALGPADESSPSPEEYSPESSSEYAYAPDGTWSGLCDYAASGVYEYMSYLDKSGLHAPDGSYKESCKEITYDCSTDTLTATCGVVDYLTNVTTYPSVFNTTSLSDAAFCVGNIADVAGALVCQELYDGNSPTPPAAPGPESPCPALELNNYYVSKLDASGSDAPDGTYKETCKQITFSCALDTIYAKCGNGRSGSEHAYLETALHPASSCWHSVHNRLGVLTCGVYPGDY